MERENVRAAYQWWRGSGNMPGLREARALERFGFALRVFGRYEEGAELLNYSAITYRQLRDAEGEARATRQYAITRYLAGKPDDAIKVVREVIQRIETLPAQDRPARALTDLHIALARGLWPGARYGESLAAAESAARFASEAKYERALPHALLQQGMLLSWLGRMPAARDTLQESITLLEQLGDTYYLAQSTGHMGRVALHLGDPTRAEKCCTEALDLLEQTGDPAELAAGVRCTLPLLHHSAPRRTCDVTGEVERRSKTRRGGR